MKKILFLLPVIAIIIAASAFTSNKQHEKKSSETLYYWFTDGSTRGSYIGEFMSHEDAVAASGCIEEVNEPCARGYTAGQLQNGVPANLGTYTDQIKKQR